MWQFFTERAKRVIQLAHREALRLGHDVIGTEHLLLGLIAEGEGVAAQVLTSMGLDLQRVYQEVLAYLSGGERTGSEQGGEAPKKKLARTKTPTLDQLGIDLTEMARNHELDPVIGREKEIQRVIQILSRRTKNNPVLIGDPGVGKTAIVEGLAQKMIAGEVPENLKGKRL
ncbi:MAG TPA: Clp protease N-terminal domain-containing protein, partial [Thermosynergistes sp.]|nr:Clp protease N-terminal domain-containing protein [Thermosynergistes sp.]